MAARRGGDSGATASAAGPTPASALGKCYPHTPIGLVNNGVHVTGAAGSPSIFTHGPVQIMRLPSQGARMMQPPPPRNTLVAPPPPVSGLTAHEKIFGGNQERTWSETTAQELARLEIVTMRQLQRALQRKLMASTRNPAGLWNAFHKLDRRGVQHLNLDDLVEGVRGFNLVASNELVKQLLHALDSDHDGVLCLAEFMAGMDGGANSLQPEPSFNISSRRHFRSIKFHHPLHNLAHLSAFHNFEEDQQ